MKGQYVQAIVRATFWEKTDIDFGLADHINGGFENLMNGSSAGPVDKDEAQLLHDPAYTFYASDIGVGNNHTRR
jgi:hypothetical protein